MFAHDQQVSANAFNDSYSISDLELPMECMYSTQQTNPTRFLDPKCQPNLNEKSGLFEFSE